MQLRHRQKGLGWFGLLFVFAVIGFTAIVVAKCFPIYMNQMKVASALNKVASNPEIGNAEGGEAVRKALQKFWDVDDITRLDYKDVKIKRSDRGRFMVYDYEAKERLFYNIYIVIHFKGEVPLRSAS
jgi:hypothetical protein